MFHFDNATAFFYNIEAPFMGEWVTADVMGMG